MKQDLIYVAETLKKNGCEVKCVLRNKDVQSILVASRVDRLPDCGRDEVLYLVRSSCFPVARPEHMPAQFICVVDHPVPEWVMEDCKSNFILTAADITENQLTDIITAIRDVQRQFGQATDRIVEALHCGQGLQAIADISSDVLGNMVAILDTNWKVLALSKHHPIKNPLMVEALESGYMDSTVVEAMKQDGWFDRLRRNGQLVMVPAFPEAPDIHGVCWCYVRVNGVVSGYMVVYADNIPFADYHIELVPLLTRYVSIELQRKETSILSQASDYETLLIDLLERKITDQAVILRRLRLLEQKVEKHLHVVALRKMSSEFPTILSAVERHELQDLFPGSLAVPYEGSLVLLVSSQDGSIPIQGNDMEAVDQTLCVSGLAAGVSNGFTDISDFARHYRQAAKALRFGWNVAGKGGIFHYSDYAIFHALELCTAQVDLRDLCHPGVLKLQESTEPGDRDLLQTLYLYLLYMKDVTRVAQLLNIHRSTLFYRLNKIKDILGSSLDDGNLVSQLLFSFKLIEYMDAFCSKNSPII